MCQRLSAGSECTVQSTYVRWKRGYAHTAEEGSDRDEAADLDRPESSSGEEDDDDLVSEVAPEEQPSGWPHSAQPPTCLRCLQTDSWKLREAACEPGQRCVLTGLCVLCASACERGASWAASARRYVGESGL